MDPASPLPTGGVWHGSNTRANRQRWAAPEDIARPGTRRTYNTEIKQQLASSTAFSATQTAQDIFAAGDVITRSSADSSSALHGYCLESVIRQGPRSTVWKASKLDDGSPVVVKVLRTSTPQQLAAAMQELQITQQATTAAAGTGNKHKQHTSLQQQRSAPAMAHATAAAQAAAAASGPETSTKELAGQQSDSGNNSNSKAPQLAQQQDKNRPLSLHFATLLDSLVIQHEVLQTSQQTAHQRHVEGAGEAEPAATRRPGHVSREAAVSCKNRSSLDSAAIDASCVGCGSADCATVALVLEPLHQSLSWVLHFVRERQGRQGLPPQVVRSIAHQLLSGLAELHDQHAVVHRDIKPSNLLLREPFVKRKARHKMRNMTLQELSSAQWSIIDLGSATQLLPPAPPQQLADSAGSSSSKSNNPARSWTNAISSALQQLIGGPVQLGAAAAATAAAAASPSVQHWTVAEGAVLPYETPAYTPPEALLHLPATAAYDIWSAACCIYEAAAGRLLFPVEAAAAARGLKMPQRSSTAAAAGNGAGVDAVRVESDEAETDADAEGFDIDQVHLQMMKRMCGGPPAQLLQRSPYASDLFADPERGQLWIEAEEAGAHGQQHHIIANALGFWGLGGKPPQPCRPVLHQLMGARSMPLDEAVALADFLQPMLAWDPLQRPTAAQLLQHPYFKPLTEDHQQQQQQQQEQQ